MPSPSLDIMWQEIRVLKSRICTLEVSVGNSIQSGLLQFRVGDLASQAYFSKGNIADIALPSDGSYQLRVNDTQIKADSLLIFLDGSLVYKGVGDRTSYSIVYDVNGFTVTKPTGDPFINTQLYLLKWEHNG